MRICVIGNSVGLRVRPPCGGDGGPYPALLRAMGHEVFNRCRAGVMITEGFGLLDEDVVRESPDAVVVNYGVVEVCFRRNVRGINNATIRNYYLNAVMGGPYSFGGGLGGVLHMVRRGLNGGIRRLASLLGLRWQWLSPARFLEVMSATVAVVRKETPATVVVLGISPCSARVERFLPGSVQAIRDVNRGLAALVADLGAGVAFLDPADVIAGEDLDDVVPDGVHFSARGHTLVADALARALSDERPRPAP